MSTAETLDTVGEAVDLQRLADLRRRLEAAATEAATVATAADQLASRLRNRAQWLAIQESEMRRRRARPSSR
jgi:hypothetical protein